MRFIAALSLLLGYAAPGPARELVEQPRRWSDPATWPDHRVPGAGADVDIAPGVHVALDATTPPLGTITVRGTLSVADRDVALTAHALRVYGAFEIGSEARPYARRAVITLTGTRAAADSLAGKAIWVMPGGRIDWHGAPRRSWLRLARTAQPGARELVLESSVDWKAGDSIVVAPTGHKPEEAEVAIVAAVRGSRLTLASPLRFQHWGELQTIAGHRVDERAEVGVLTRHIVIQGDPGSERDGFGGHVLVSATATARIDGVELVRMGQRGMLARYPMHWHLAGDVAGQYVRRSSIVHSYNRCVTVHGSHEALVEDNVCYDHVGHGFILEDGVEHGNTIRGNLGLLARVGTVLPSDKRPATFWLANPANVVEGNAAAGSPGAGFWYDLPGRPTGEYAGSPLRPGHMPLGRFADNVAHSNQGNGLIIEGSGSGEGAGRRTNDFRPRANPDDINSAPVPALFERFTAFANRRAFWSRGDHHHIAGAVIVNNAIGVQFGDATLRAEQVLSGSLVAGRTANTAAAPTDPQRGFLLYDGNITLDSVVFANFTGQSAAITSPPGVGIASPANGGRNVSFVNATPFRFPTAPRSNGAMQVVYVDMDGSVTGKAGASVVSRTALMRTGACTDRPEWNAQICDARYVRVDLTSNPKIQAAPVSPALVTRDDGATQQMLGYLKNVLSLTVPLGHVYRIAPAGGTPPNFGVIARGLAPGQIVDVAVPYTVRSSDAAIAAEAYVKWPTARPGSCAGVRASRVSAAAYDAASGAVCIRLVGREGAADNGILISPKRTGK